MLMKRVEGFTFRNEATRRFMDWLYHEPSDGSEAFGPKLRTEAIDTATMYWEDYDHDRPTPSNDLEELPDLLMQELRREAREHAASSEGEDGLLKVLTKEMIFTEEPGLRVNRVRWGEVAEAVLKLDGLWDDYENESEERQCLWEEWEAEHEGEDE